MLFKHSKTNNISDVACVRVLGCRQRREGRGMAAAREGRAGAAAREREVWGGHRWLVAVVAYWSCVWK
jgi:hypothetical protein